MNAVVTLTPERALAASAAADERLAHGADVGPRHDIPVAHKDTHDTAGLRTTYGSPVVASNVHERDELLIERMRGAGMITLGKTNVPEFGAESHTVNPLFGATRNRYDLTRSAGGSSGGAAAAAGVRYARPRRRQRHGWFAAQPGVVLQRRGAAAHAGAGADLAERAALGDAGGAGADGTHRGRRGAAAVRAGLAGPRSPTALVEPGSAFAAPLDGEVSGLRVAWSPDLGGAVPVDPAVRQVQASAAKSFAELGAAVVEDRPDSTGADEVFRTLRAWQFLHVNGPLLDSHPG